MSTAGHTPYCVVMSSIYTLPCSSVPTMFSGFLGFSQCEWLCGTRGINNPRSVQGPFQATTIPAGHCPTGHQHPAIARGWGTHARLPSRKPPLPSTPHPRVLQQLSRRKGQLKASVDRERVWGLGG